MIKFQRISGVNLDAENLPVINITPEGEAMGAVPGWGVYVDPKTNPDGGQTVRNQAIRNGNATQDSGSRVVVLGDINGTPAFDHTSESGQFNVDLPVNGINPEAWSVFFALSSGSGPNVQTIFAERPAVAAGDGIGLNVALNAAGTNVLVYEGTGTGTGQISRFDTTSVLSNGVPSLIMVTFSTSRGFALYKNGQLVNSDDSDKRPLTNSQNANAVRHGFAARGLQGDMGILNIDLGAPENTGHRRSIEKFLMDKYGIPQGPQ